MSFTTEDDCLSMIHYFFLEDFFVSFFADAVDSKLPLPDKNSLHVYSVGVFLPSRANYHKYLAACSSTHSKFSSCTDDFSASGAGLRKSMA